MDEAIGGGGVHGALGDLEGVERLKAKGLGKQEAKHEALNGVQKVLVVQSRAEGGEESDAPAGSEGG